MTIKLFLLALVSTFVVSCGNTSLNHDGHNHEAMDHGHEAEEENIDHASTNYTLFSDSYELFVEFSPLTINHTSNFTVFLTDLAKYQPVRSGELTATLIINKKGIRQKVDNPVQSGVFMPALQPSEAGVGQLVFTLKRDEELVSFTIDSIQVYATDEEAEAAIHEEEKGTEISFLKEQSWKTDFRVNQIVNSDFREVISTSGQLLSAPNEDYVLVAPYAGIVSFQGHLIEGKEVNSGSVLVSISGNGLSADNIALQNVKIKSSYEKAKVDYERAQKLAQDKIVSEKELLDLKIVYDQAEVAFKNKAHASVTSPVNGIVKEVLIENGAFVEAGTKLLILSKNSKMLLKADVSQVHWHCLPDVVEANFIAPYLSHVYSTEELNGQLLSYSKTAVNSSWSSPVYFQIDNDNKLIAGSYVEIFLLSKIRKNRLSVPVDALIEEQGKYFVFVQLSGESYEKREVTIGDGNGKRIEIVKGIKHGERVVTQGAYQVKLASVSAALPAHNHNH